MLTLPEKHRRWQQSFSTKGALGYPTGDVLYVDSVNGADGSTGHDQAHALLTLARALALCAAGDTIVLNPGGSESISATIAANVARVKIVCPVESAHSGYTITGAGSLDLVTVSAADVHLEGLKFTRTAGAGAATASVLVTAAGDRCVVKNCLVDNSDLTSAWTNFGVEFTDDCLDVTVDGLETRDCHRGVMFSIATGKTQVGWQVLNSTFWVGQATAFGVYCDPTSTGVSNGFVIAKCHFHEGDGDGTAATDVWDGSSGADAASGPLLIGALADRGVIAGCTAYTALSRSFDQLVNVSASSLAQQIGNETSTPNADASGGWREATKTITLGTGSVPVTENLFTVTGEVRAIVFGFIDTAVTSGGALTLELGVTGGTAGIIAITALAQLAINRFWVDTTTTVGYHAAASEAYISAANILHVIRDFDATAGAITYYCLWQPVSDDGAVVAV